MTKNNKKAAHKWAKHCQIQNTVDKQWMVERNKDLKGLKQSKNNMAAQGRAPSKSKSVGLPRLSKGALTLILLKSLQSVVHCKGTSQPLQ